MGIYVETPSQCPRVLLLAGGQTVSLCMHTDLKKQLEDSEIDYDKILALVVKDLDSIHTDLLRYNNIPVDMHVGTGSKFRTYKVEDIIAMQKALSVVN